MISSTGIRAAALLLTLGAMFPVGLQARAEANSRPAVAATNVSAGTSHSLAVAKDGRVWSWGLNGNGQLGDAGVTDRVAPVQVVGLAGAVAVSGGTWFSMALRSDGTVWAWGSNEYGQLGDGTTSGRLTPVQASGLTGAVAVSAGSRHSLALKNDGTVWAWGWNNYGQLGDGTTTNRSTPVQVAGLTGVVAIAAGTLHNLALKSDGTVWGWGYNLSSQLGDGTSTNQTRPVQASGLAGVVAIAAGSSHSMVLKFDRTVWSWGSNFYGQLGDGMASGGSRKTPGQISGLTGVTAMGASSDGNWAVKGDGTLWVWGNSPQGATGDGTRPGLVEGLTGVASAAMGFSHMLALKVDGSIWAWGDNRTGQLGTGKQTHRGAPGLVKGLTGVSRLASGGSHGLALRGDDTVWTWGVNEYGQLGDGTNVDRNTPVQASGLPGVIALAAGSAFSLALRSNGTVLAWGYNYNGQLGDGSQNSQSTPVPVSGLTGVTAITAGYYHSLALRNDGTVRAWGGGYTNHGQLGDGTMTSRSTPVQVSGLTGVTAVAAGGEHSLALKGDGTVWAWGYNAYGQLGDGTTTDRSTPVQVSGLTGVVALAAGGTHSLALRSDGTLWAWGNNSNGRLGDGSSTTRNTPVQVKVLTGVAAVTAGPAHNLALRNDGTLWAWGWNSAGQLGDRTLKPRSTPVQVAGISGVVAMAVGQEQSLALTGDGTVLAWGENYSGQLGDGVIQFEPSPVPVIPLAGPDLTITKEHSGDSSAGLTAVFTLTVRNIGKTATSGPVTVTDTLPIGLTNPNAFGENWTCSVNGQILTCTNPGPIEAGWSSLTPGTPPAGSVSTITLNADVAASAFPGVTNIATVSNASDRTGYNDATGDPLYVTGNGCAYSVNPLTVAFPVSGGNAGFTIQTDATCPWTVFGLPSWLTVSGASASAGPGTVTITATANTGITRIATVLIAGASVRITQAAGVCAYTLSAAGQSFSPTGGTGTVDITTGTGCQWSAVSPSPWLTLSNTFTVTGSGRITYVAAANTSGAARSATLTIAGIGYTVQQAGPLPANAAFAGAMPQVASGQGWKTTFTITNIGAAATAIRLNFWSDGGSELVIPMAFPQSAAGGVIQGSTLDRTIEAGATLIVESEAAETAPVQVGWAELLSPGLVSGLAVFRQRSGDGSEQEAAVPLESRAVSGYVLPFDNSAGYATGVAVANHTSGAVNLTVIERDDAGRQLSTETLPLPARGHTSFDLKSRWPALGNRRGSIEVRGPVAGGLSILGLRFHPMGPFTTLPVAPK